MKLLRWLLPLVSLTCVLMFTMWDLNRSSTGPGPLHSMHNKVVELEHGARCEGCHEAGAGIAEKACTKCHGAIAEQEKSHTGLHGELDASLQGRCERCHSEHHGDEIPLITAHAFPRAGVPDPAAYDHKHVRFTLTGAHSTLACVRCHVQANLSIAAEGARFLGLSQQCASCHEDKHRGAFGNDCAKCHGQEVPFKDAPNFKHEQFALTASHSRVACNKCHEPGSAHDVKLLEQKVPPTVRTCDQCHEDPHGADSKIKQAIRLPGVQDCARCHSAETWEAARPTAEAHADYGFALPGPHAKVACAACHGDGDSNPRWRVNAPKLEQCAVCHESPHSAPVMAAAVAAQGPATGCADCHLAADADFKTGRMSAAQHAATGFALVLPHAEVACAKCHVGTAKVERFPGRTADDCRACHQDVHGGQFAADTRYRQCTACHDKAHFLPPAFGIAAHAVTRFPLTGAHDAVACVSCHKDTVGNMRTFHGTPSECSACHEDVHKGLFDRGGRPKVVDGRAGCARCHDTNAFVPVAAATFDHGVWTGYQLAGAHEQLACAKCHPTTTKDESAGLNVGAHLGRAAGTTCNACHQDPHAGQFASLTGTDCARCHADTDWHALKFDHQHDSRFVLDSTHVKLECAKCHLGYQARGTTIVRYKPLGMTCGDCHRMGKAGEVLR